MAMLSNYFKINGRCAPSFNTFSTIMMCLDINDMEYNKYPNGLTLSFIIHAYWMIEPRFKQFPFIHENIIYAPLNNLIHVPKLYSKLISFYTWKDNLFYFLRTVSSGTGNCSFLVTVIDVDKELDWALSICFINQQKLTIVLLAPDYKKSPKQWPSGPNLILSVTYSVNTHFPT